MAPCGYPQPMAVSTPEQERSLLLDRMDRFLREHPGLDQSPSLSATDTLPPPSLTISRQCGAGLCRIERPLLEYLDEMEGRDFGAWALFDQSLLGRFIESRQGNSRKIAFSPDLAKFPVMPVLEEQLSRPQEQWTLFNHSANAIRQLCRSGRCLIVGRAGNLVACDLANTFHVRLIADKSKRIRFISNRFQVNESGASELVEETDKARAQFVKRNTGSDIDDPVSYHLILNTEGISDEVAVRVIAESMYEWSNLRPISADRKRNLPENRETGAWSAPNVIPGGF